jgi:hypothetical protein
MQEFTDSFKESGYSYKESRDFTDEFNACFKEFNDLKQKQMKTPKQMKQEMNLYNSKNSAIMKMAVNWLWVCTVILLAISPGCKKSDPQVSSMVSADQNTIDMRLPHSRDFEPITLVADTAGYHALRIDHNLSNAWGLAVSDEGDVWVASNHKGLAVIYNKLGMQVDPPVNVPFNGDPNGGAPTGAIYNESNSFIIPSTGEKSEFIYATENGTIAAWASGNHTITVVNRSGMDAVYKGLADGESNGTDYIYATDFKNNHVDVFDGSFNYVSMRFNDPGIPAGFAPFGIQNIDGKLYVTTPK